MGTIRGIHEALYRGPLLVLYLSDNLNRNPFYYFLRGYLYDFEPGKIDNKVREIANKLFKNTVEDFKSKKPFANSRHVVEILTTTLCFDIAKMVLEKVNILPPYELPQLAFELKEYHQKFFKLDRKLLRRELIKRYFTKIFFGQDQLETVLSLSRKDNSTASTSSPMEGEPKDNPLLNLVQQRLSGKNIFLPICSQDVVLSLFNAQENKHYSSGEVRKNAGLQLELMGWFAKAIDMPIVYPFMNLSIEPQAVALANDKGSVISEGITGVKPSMNIEINKPQDLILPNPYQDELMRQRIDFIQAARQDAVLGTRQILCWIAGPFTLLGNLIGAEEVCLFSIDKKQEDKFKAWLDYTVLSYYHHSW